MPYVFYVRALIYTLIPTAQGSLPTGDLHGVLLRLRRLMVEYRLWRLPCVVSVCLLFAAA